MHLQMIICSHLFFLPTELFPYSNSEMFAYEQSVTLFCDNIQSSVTPRVARKQQIQERKPERLFTLYSATKISICTMANKFVISMSVFVNTFFSSAFKAIEFWIIGLVRGSYARLALRSIFPQQALEKQSILTQKPCSFIFTSFIKLLLVLPFACLRFHLAISTLYSSSFLAVKTILR